jgi:hypothetical protein
MGVASLIDRVGVVKTVEVTPIRPEASRSSYEQVEGFWGLNPWMLQNSGMTCN